MSERAQRGNGRFGGDNKLCQLAVRAMMMWQTFRRSHVFKPLVAAPSSTLLFLPRMHVNFLYIDQSTHCPPDVHRRQHLYRYQHTVWHASRCQPQPQPSTLQLCLNQRASDPSCPSVRWCGMVEPDVEAGAQELPPGGVVAPVALHIGRRVPRSCRPEG